MIYPNEADFRLDTKWWNIAHLVTPFRHFVSALKLFPGDRFQILLGATNELLNTHKLIIGLEWNDE